MTHRWTNGEPKLREILHDEVVLAVMNRDGVSRQELDELIRSVQRQLDDTTRRDCRRVLPANDSSPQPQA
jgi:hypothetical protein